MNHQLERAAVAESNGCKVTQVARCQSADAERFGEGHDRTIYQPETQSRVAPVHFHRT